MAQIDFESSGGGTMHVFHPLTPEASDWVAEHLRQCSAPRGRRRDQWRYIEELTGWPPRTGPRSGDN